MKTLFPNLACDDERRKDRHMYRKAGIRQAVTGAPATGGLRLGCGNIHGGEDAMCGVWTREEGRF